MTSASSEYEVELSRLWLDVEFQHWMGDRDQIAKFSINEYGYLHVEYFENIDPDDTLIDITQFNLTRYIPRTAQQFLEIISENAPGIFIPPHLCSVSYKGDRDVLAIMWDFIDTNIVDGTSIPDEEIDFVKASRQHMPKTSTDLVKELKSSREFDSRRILYVGEEEWILSSHEISDVAIPISEFNLCDLENEPDSTLFSFSVQSNYGAKFRFRLVQISREYSIGFAKYADEEYWFRVAGAPGQATGVFVADKISKIFEESYAKPIISVEQLKTLLLNNLETLGGNFSISSQDLNLNLNLGTNSFDISMFASRVNLSRDFIEKLNSCSSFSCNGELSKSIYSESYEPEMYKFSLDIQGASDRGEFAWSIQFTSGLGSYSRRIYEVDQNLVDVLLRIFIRETLVFSIDGKDSHELVELPDSNLDLYYSFRNIELVFSDFD